MTIKPKPRCRVRGFVEEMGAFLQRPMCMSLEGGANRPRPPNNENSDRLQCGKTQPLTLRRFRLLSALGAALSTYLARPDLRTRSWEASLQPSANANEPSRFGSRIEKATTRAEAHDAVPSGATLCATL